MRHVFVITFGRTGSTLLQGLLNSMSGVVIFGENSGFLLPMMDAYAALRSAHSHLRNPKNDRPGMAWYGASRYSEDALKAQFRAFIDDVLFARFPDGSNITAAIVGFKEIKHLFLGNMRLENYLEFLKELYPNSRFIFLTRNVEEVISSGWYAKINRETMRKQIMEFCDITSEFAKNNSHSCFSINYSDMIKDYQTYEKLGVFLEISTNISNYNHVISISHSYNNRSLTRLLNKQCSDTTLFREDWWRSSVDEFTIQVERTGRAVAVTGALILRPEHRAELFFSDGRSSVPVVFSVETPNLKARFPHHPGADRAGYAVSFEGSVERIELLSKEGSVLARAEVPAQ